MEIEYCDRCTLSLDEARSRKRLVILRTVYDTKDEFTSTRTYEVCESCYQGIKSEVIDDD